VKRCYLVPRRNHDDLLWRLLLDLMHVDRDREARSTAKELHRQLGSCLRERTLGLRVARHSYRGTTDELLREDIERPLVVGRQSHDVLVNFTVSACGIAGAIFGGFEGGTTAPMNVTVVAVEDATLYDASAAFVTVTVHVPAVAALSVPLEIVHPLCPGRSRRR